MAWNSYLILTSHNVASKTSNCGLTKVTPLALRRVYQWSFLSLGRGLFPAVRPIKLSKQGETPQWHSHARSHACMFVLKYHPNLLEYVYT